MIPSNLTYLAHYSSCLFALSLVSDYNTLVRFEICVEFCFLFLVFGLVWRYWFVRYAEFACFQVCVGLFIIFVMDRDSVCIGTDCV